MNIAVRLEGGIGDHIAAARFIPAIREANPGCRIVAFSDTDGQTFQRDFLVTLWPNLFEKIEVMSGKAESPYYVKNQFSNKENYPAAIENMAKCYQEAISKYDKFYDLHIDGLNWMSYDFNWNRYFHRFPKPEISLEPVIEEKDYVLLNLYADTNPTNRLEPWYVNRLVETLSKSYNLVIAATDKNEGFYDKCAPHAKIVKMDIAGVTRLIANAKLFLTLDSGLKYVGYCTNTPTLNFCSQVSSYGEVPQHQIVRWQPFPYSALPLHYPINKVKEAIDFCIKYKTNLLPICEFDRVFVKRNNTVWKNS